MVGVAKDIIENNIRVWKSLLKLVSDGIFFKHSMLFRMRCQAAGARYGDVNQAAKNAQVRAEVGFILQFRRFVQYH